jgi:beta-carotene ketolase (CrtO type)
MYDAIIIGAGHNGLTCAAYLARAGRKVLVLEAWPEIGGMCRTEEIIPEAPGFRTSSCALDTLLTNIPVSVVDELELSKYGLEFVWPDPWGSYVNPDGASIAMWRSAARTKEEIAKFSRKDAAAFEHINKVFGDAFKVIAPYLQDHPIYPRPRTVLEVAGKALKSQRSLREAARLMLGSPEQLLMERFEREEVRAGLASLASWSQLPIWEPGSLGGLAICDAYFTFGCSRPVTGAGAFTQALAAVVRAHGGVVRANAPVAKVMVRDGIAQGVALESGEEIWAKQVVGAISPKTLISDLLDPEWVPEKVADEVRAMRVLGPNIAPMKVDAALTHAPHLACGRDELWQGLMLMAPTMEDVKKAQMSCLNKELPTSLQLSPVLPSVIDRSLVPAGSEGETLYVYLPTVPCEIAGKDWSDVRESFGEAIFDELELYIPGLKAATIGTYIKTPREVSEEVYRGNLYHVDISLNQMGPNRPTRSLSGYRTPVKGLWHSAAGAHPVGALNGWSGRSTARVVEKQLRGVAGRIPVYGSRVAGRNGAAISGNGHRPNGSMPLTSVGNSQSVSR